ncbi:MAG: NADH:ubiquinone reductase (Na(+)-transporting) subunit A, partial [bacterium]|nr:NADH:ubiquinone reductase (Na(+)-transporting) subunit A [bacterium]
MAVHKIRKGLTLPIQGAPEQAIDDARPPDRVALVAADSIGMKPTMHVTAGDEVRRGQLLFEDKKTPGVRYTAIAGGRITAVNRGAQRVLQSVVIELDDDERAGKAESVGFAADTGKDPAELDGDQVRDLLVESGLWTAIRTRPFSKVADPQTRPRSIFVTACDSSPLAPAIDVVLAGREEDFERGLVALSKLTEGPVYVCTAPGANLRVPSDGRIRVEEFTGPHPAGTVGVHIHLLDPVCRGKLVWNVGCQDVAAMGKLFAGGGLDPTRIVALAGPPVTKPRLLRTRLGAAIDQLVTDELAEGEMRIISGSVLSGRAAQGDIHGYLGRYHQQVSVLAEGRDREFMGWAMPGFGKFSTLGAYASILLPGKKYAFTTNAQ